jgi:flagellar protein FlgJ
VTIHGVQGVAGAASPTALSAGDTSVKHAAAEFEAYLIQVVLKEMRATIPGGGTGGAGLGGDVFQSIVDQALATEMAKTGGIGLARAVVDHATKGGRISP